MERRALGCPFHGGLVSSLRSQEAKTHLGRRILARRSHFGAMMVGLKEQDLGFRRSPFSFTVARRFLLCSACLLRPRWFSTQTGGTQPKSLDEYLLLLFSGTGKRSEGLFCHFTRCYSK